jgi:hypothetical protein
MGRAHVCDCTGNNARISNDQSPRIYRSCSAPSGRITAISELRLYDTEPHGPLRNTRARKAKGLRSALQVAGSRGIRSQGKPARRDLPNTACAQQAPHLNLFSVIHLQQADSHTTDGRLPFDNGIGTVRSARSNPVSEGRTAASTRPSLRRTTQCRFPWQRWIGNRPMRDSPAPTSLRALARLCAQYGAGSRLGFPASDNTRTARWHAAEPAGCLPRATAVAE